jgi:hypothetical protein
MERRCRRSAVLFEFFAASLTLWRLGTDPFMQAPFDTSFLVRRITQLWVEAADLPEKSHAQAHIEELACKLSDYVSRLPHEASGKCRKRDVNGKSPRNLGRT